MVKRTKEKLSEELKKQCLKALDKCIEVTKGQAQFAALIEESPQTIQGWRYRRIVPPEKVLKIEAALNGQVKRSELRPDIYPPDEYKGK